MTADRLPRPGDTYHFPEGEARVYVVDRDDARARVRCRTDTGLVVDLPLAEFQSDRLQRVPRDHDAL